MSIRILLIFLLIIVAGCSAALVPLSNDPAAKLSQAKELLSLNRALPAERLIREAMTIYEQRQDLKGLANATADYGLMLDSSAYRSYEKSWRDSGTYDPTGKTAIQYLEKALALFGKVGDPEGERFASFQLGRLYKADGQTGKACAAYDLSNQYHQEARRQFPDHKFYISPGYKGWEDMVASLKASIGCP